ncbi:MAG: hypothetical protein ACYCYO_12535 [Bacilli bacterium]
MLTTNGATEEPHLVSAAVVARRLRMPSWWYPCRPRGNEKASSANRASRSTQSEKNNRVSGDNRERSRVEHVNKQLTANGGRDGRYYGTRKTEGQLRLCASLHNIVGIGWIQRIRKRDRRATWGEVRIETGERAKNEPQIPDLNREAA